MVQSRHDKPVYLALWAIFSRCRKMEQRKHLWQSGKRKPCHSLANNLPSTVSFSIPNKTCRYCPHCDLLIAHQDDVEHVLASIFTQRKPEIVGNDYLVVGTLEKIVWKRGTQQPLTLQETLEALHDFKEVVTFKLTGGWSR